MEEQLTFSIVVVWLINKLKAHPSLPWIDETTVALNKVIAVAAAAITSVGIHYNWTPETGTLVLTGISLTAVLHWGWNFATALITQESIYTISKTAKVKQITDGGKGAKKS